MDEESLNISLPYLDNISMGAIDYMNLCSRTPSYTWNYDNKENEITNLKKIISRMAKFINKLDVDEEICSKVKLGTCEKYNNGNCEKCIIEYFKKEVQNEN